MSVPTSTVPGMDSDDVVDPGDAAIQALLALTAEDTQDPEKHDWLIDAILTVPPLTEWPSECQEKFSETAQFVRSLAQDLRHRGEIHDAGADSHRRLQTMCEPHEHEPHGDGP
jgi:hypothetical protein